VTQASANPSAAATRRRPRLGLSARIVLALVLGVLAGLFVGEPAAALQPVADVYIRLMQMTVLPYLVLTLIIGIGRMEAPVARRLAVRGGVLLLVFWGLALAVIGLVTMAFPAVENASFFSSSLLVQREPLALHEIYVPSNPFNALANAIIPAVVLFSTALGAALIGVPGKAGLLANLQVAEQAVVRVTRFVISLTPFGVFAIAAVAAGTLAPDTMARLEVYLVCFAVASLLLAFVVLPTIVAAVTPFTYREVVSVSRDALLTAFVANSAFIVLPMLVEQSNALMDKHRVRTPEASSSVETLVPLAFTFPNAGKLLTLLFVPYAAWLAGNPLEVDSYGALFGAGVFAYFAKAQVALPFLLDLVRVPQDHFQLYIPTTIVTGKFDSMVSAMSLLAFSLIGAAAMAGFLRMRPARVLAAATLVLAVVGAAIFGTRVLLASVVDTTYRKADMLKQMYAPRNSAEAIVYSDLSVLKPDPAHRTLSALERVRARGSLRVAFDIQNAPFSFYNEDGQLVGFDIELVHHLAQSLGVRLELVAVGWREAPTLLDEGVVDLMPGVWYRPFWFSKMRLSEPYLVGTMALVVRDERRQRFARIEDLRASRGLKIGVPLDASQVRFSLERYFGDADIAVVPLESSTPFLEGRFPWIDAFLMPAESASAATLLHPEYSVVVPQPDPVSLPTAFGMARDARDLAEWVNEWVVFARSEGAISRAYDYWILGKGAEPRRRRWSIARDVLGWNW
jgi:Na+/H+-dicarboxylate symporter